MRTPLEAHLPTRSVLLGLLLACAVAGSPSAQTQGPSPSTERAERAERFRRMSQEAEARGLAEPFKGITKDGQIISGLFAIRSTGVSTEPVRQAAVAFLASLSPEQRAKTAFPVNDDEWRKWMNPTSTFAKGSASPR